MESTEKSYDVERNSTRIQAKIPLCVTSLDPANPISEQCHTLVLNTQGCGVQLSRPLEPGVPVRLDGLPGGRPVTARVANCVPVGTAGKFWVVGLALDQAGNVWGIDPVPADWGSEPRVVAADAPIPAKKNEWPYRQFSNRGEFHPGRK